jgi:hypothetical protein
MLIYMFSYLEKSSMFDFRNNLFFFYYCFLYDKIWNEILNSDGQQLHQTQQKL